MSESLLEQLWAGWRNEYVVSATDAERHKKNGECVFCRIAASGEPRPRIWWCGAAPSVSRCSTPTPMRAAIFWSCRCDTWRELDASTGEEAEDLWVGTRRRRHRHHDRL